ncbi:arylmalonate decarboxylase [Nonomuraea sp. SYSU D8015]|uniref:arylmalonate decarboxylase n=1 Tax=Nonomuraea sp. SYSU D8015 TaxID=2593644 RepID=UPI0016617FE0|nr:arylmalonate decarboxylase [Nonomuraea sp. SYSU D8015]
MRTQVLAAQAATDAAVLRGRVGLVVPPSNPTVESEITRLLGTGYAVHTTRFSVSHQPLRARLESYNAELPDKIISFGGLKLDALLVACSGSRYLLGAHNDHDDCAALSAQFDVPISTATLATHQVLRRLDTRALVLVSQYEAWLTEHARQYWRRAGWRVRVLAIRPGTRYAPYAVGAAELVEQVARAHLPHDAVLLCTGAGTATLQALPELGHGNNRVLLTSNLCSAWWLIHQAGAAPDEGLPWALRRLAAQGLAP